MSYLKYTFVFLTIGLFAQTKFDESQLKVFEPSEISKDFNKVYTQNFFYGNFGLKQLIAAVPINNENVKTVEISAESSVVKNVPVMELHYNLSGNLIQMKIMEAFFGTAMTVDYEYKDGYLAEEKLTRSNEKIVNRFYYTDDKMIIENSRGLLDVYSMEAKLLIKNSYVGGELVLSDRLVRNCRLTNYQRKPINKICYSNLNSELPLSIEKYTNNENETGRLVLQIDEILSVNQSSDHEYDINIDGQLRYKLKLDQESRVAEFSYLGNKEDKTNPVNYKFNYIYIE